MIPSEICFKKAYCSTVSHRFHPPGLPGRPKMCDGGGVAGGLGMWPVAITVVTWLENTWIGSGLVS